MSKNDGGAAAAASYMHGERTCILGVKEGIGKRKTKEEKGNDTGLNKAQK